MADPTGSSEDELQFQVDDILTSAVSITAPKLPSTSGFRVAEAGAKCDDSSSSDESDARQKTPIVTSSFATHEHGGSFSADTPHTGISRLDQGISHHMSS